MKRYETSATVEMYIHLDAETEAASGQDARLAIEDAAKRVEDAIARFAREACATTGLEFDVSSQIERSISIEIDSPEHLDRQIEALTARRRLLMAS